MIIELPATIEGLKYNPSFIDKAMNDEDWPNNDYQAWCHRNYGSPLANSHYAGEGKPEFSDDNVKVLESCLDLLYILPGDILEIGVCRSGNCSTKTILKNKPPEVKCLGVDLRNVPEFHKPESNSYFLNSSSTDQSRVRATLKEYGFGPLGLLVIDGWHSINVALNDFAYTDLLLRGGKVFIHDTNYHPGPVELVRAIDTTKFDVFKTCLNDHGATVLTKRF
jgi:hypothetical protein